MASNNSDLISHIKDLREDVKDSKSCSCSWVLSLDHTRSEISSIATEGNKAFSQLKSQYMAQIRDLQNELHRIQSDYRRELSKLRKEFASSQF